MAKERVSSIFVTPVVRASYAQLATPKASAGSKDLKFSINLIFNKEDAGGIYAEICKVATERFGANALAMFESGGLKQPLKNGSTPNKKTLVVDPTTDGKFFVTAKAAADKQPVVVGVDGATALNASAIYSGCFVRAQISIYTFENAESQGVAIGLNYVQFVRDGDRLGGGAPSIAQAVGVFGAVPGAAATGLANLGIAGAPPPSLPGGTAAPVGTLGLPG